MDNHDVTLSIFGTVIDHAAPTSTPASGTAAGSFDQRTLASLSRSFAYNDPQNGGNPAFGEPKGEGEKVDRNVELIVGDPRAGAAGRPRDRGEGRRGDGSGDTGGGGDGGGKDNDVQTVTDSSGELPFTGLGLAAPILLGLALLATGTMARRRLRG